MPRYQKRKPPNVHGPTASDSGMDEARASNEVKESLIVVVRREKKGEGFDSISGCQEVRSVVETAIRRIWRDVEGVDLPERLPVMTYTDAMSRVRRQPFSLFESLLTYTPLVWLR